MKQYELSVVIPVYNEEGNIAKLYDHLLKALINYNYEIIFIDDGSSDNTVINILNLPPEHLTFIQFSRNFGQTPALAAGIEAARGTYIATLDGDLQNDPFDIPLMLEKLKKENLDIVAGKREKRQDGFILRKIPSYCANRLIQAMTHINIHDYGCTLKIFRASLAKNLDLYGELHRFIPILGALQGARMQEMSVRHFPRFSGKTKYGINRTLKVMSDLFLMMFFLKYRQKPMHLFGTLGLVSFFIGGTIELYLLVLKLMGEPIGGRPLFYIGIVCIIASIQFITTGFISELLMRTFHAAKNSKPYTIIKLKREENE